MNESSTRAPLALAFGALLVAGIVLPPGAARAAADPQVTEAPGVTTPAAKDKRAPLRLRYLANEGFLIEVGDKAVLFDAFLAMPYAGYPSMSQELVDKLRSAEEPFASIDLALTSHGHADHFQERVARDFLLASPETPFATTPQALAALEKVTEDPIALRPRLHSHHPKATKVEAQAFGDLKVRFLRLPHGGMPDVQNVGTLLSIGGHTVLHLGDADVEAEDFKPYAEELKEVDVALVPYWFYATNKGRKIVADYLPARVHVAMHFPKRQLEKVVESFLENHEGVRAFSKPLDEATFE